MAHYWRIYNTYHYQRLKSFYVWYEKFTHVKDD